MTSEHPDVLDARRAPRLPLRLAMTLRHRRRAWNTETEDIGPRGCQVVTDHALPAGSDVALSVSCPALGHAIGARGRVAWSRSDAPARLGIAFEVPTAHRDWFDALLAADPRARRAAARTPLRLPRDAPLSLGEPPGTVIDFSEDERAVLTAIGAGRTAGELADLLARRFHRARGALFSLIARRLVRLQPGAAAITARWLPILAPGQGATRPAEARRLYAEGLAHLGAGRAGIAVARFREALALAPEDEEIARALARLEKWV